jgi:hypothetical protein
MTETDPVPETLCLKGSVDVKNGGAVPPFHTSSYHSAYLFKHKDNFTFTLCLKGKSKDGGHKSKVEVVIVAT